MPTVTVTNIRLQFDLLCPATKDEVLAAIEDINHVLAQGTYSLDAQVLVDESLQFTAEAAESEENGAAVPEEL